MSRRFALIELPALGVLLVALAAPIAADQPAATRRSAARSTAKEAIKRGEPSAAQFCLVSVPRCSDLAPYPAVPCLLDSPRCPNEAKLLLLRFRPRALVIPRH